MNDEDKVEEQVKAVVEEATTAPELAFSVELSQGRMRVGGTLQAPAWMLLGLIEAAKQHYLERVVAHPPEPRIKRPGLVLPH
jgi:hypothetical protein